MGLFDRKKSEFTLNQPLYTLGQSQNLLVVGLGNVGDLYKKNRHNLGFMAIDRYKESHDFSSWIEKKDLQCYFSLGTIGNTRVLLIKPTTFMNESGVAVQKIQKFYKILSTDTVVVYDELDVEFGTVRTRAGGGSAGHNGIKSLLLHIDKNFGRIRIGIGPKDPPQMDSADFVLQNFSEKQQELIPKILREVSSIIDERTVGPISEMTISIS